MNKTMIKFGMVFLSGVATGVAATYRYFSSKCDKTINEEIAAIRHTHHVTAEEVSQKNKETNDVQDKLQKETATREEYEELLRQTGYIGDENPEPKAGSYLQEIMEKKQKGELSETTRPEIISENELGEIDEYDIVGLVYYADGILADDCNIPVDDIEGTVSHDVLNLLVETQGVVYVRNDEIECYFEIAYDLAEYNEVVRPTR